MVLLFTLFFAVAVSAECYEASTAHPLPDLDANDAVLKHAFAEINTALTVAVAAPEYASTSFSVEITSSKQTLWSRFQTARERNASRPDIPEVNGDALYRIASITKTFTVLGILQQHQAGNLSLDDPIEKYITELKDDQEGTLPWKDITLRSLASQLSGVPREFAQSDFINGPSHLPNPLDMGLPPVSREGLIDCDEYSPNYEKPCRVEDLLDAVKRKRPLLAPNMKSTYSNVGLEILGLALARVTRQTYESYIEEAIFKPLKMTKSTFSRPPDSAGVIPLNPRFWDVDEGIQNPTGGLYSSATDLSKYLRYILSHYNAIATGVNWLHPVSPSHGIHSFFGMPWEIMHTDRVLKHSKRTVRFITKGGGLPGYNSLIILVPDFDIGITILVAGEAGIFSKILESVSTIIVRAAEEVSIRQLHERYAGTYISSKKSLDSTITIAADSRGLVVERFISNGTDVLKAVFDMYQTSRAYLQLVPTLLFRNEKKQQGELWRAIVSHERVDGERDVWDDQCVTDIDQILYAGASFNEMTFWDKFDDGKYGTVELSAFRVNLTRSTDKEGSESHEQEMFEL